MSLLIELKIIKMIRRYIFAWFPGAV